MVTNTPHDARPAGFSSRVKKAAGKESLWKAPNGQIITLPLLVDHVNTDNETGKRLSSVEAVIDLVEGQPVLVDVRVRGYPKLDVKMLQRFFRWNTPLDIVVYLIPSLLENNIDPYSYWFPTDGFPDVAKLNKKPNSALSDEFLRELARQYVEIGRGYAKTIANQRGVSERTVISWVEKARKRGFLEKTKPGKRTYIVNEKKH